MSREARGGGMPAEGWFEQVGTSLRSAPGVMKVGVRPDKLVIEAAQGTLVMDGDLDDPDRVAIWSVVDLPAGLSVEAIARTCEAVTADHAVEDGCVLAFNAQAGFLVLGRSTHVTELERDAAEVVATVLRVRREATVIDDIARELAADAAPPSSAGVAPPAPTPSSSETKGASSSKGLLGGLAGLFGGRDGR